MSEILKIILVGDSAAGKSAFLSKLCKKSHNEVKNQRVTVGAEIKVLDIECGEKDFKLCIWDCGSYRLNSPFNKIFFMEANAAIIMYDVSYPSCPIIKKIQDEINGRLGDIPTVLIGSKSDLKSHIGNAELQPFMTLNINESITQYKKVIEKIMSDILGDTIVIKNIIDGEIDC